MKTRLLFALVGFAISFALPSFAQETNKPDPKLHERLIPIIQKHNDAINSNDDATVAANFKEDAVNVEQEGTTFGPILASIILRAGGGADMRFACIIYVLR